MDRYSCRGLPLIVMICSLLLRSTTLCKAQTGCTVAPPPGSYSPSPGIPQADADLIEVALNLEYLEAEFFLNSAYGKGLDYFDPSLAAGGPPPIGAQQANLDALTKDITEQLGLQEVGHLRAIKQTIPDAFPRVLLNISKGVFAQIMDTALGYQLQPPFDPYANSINFLLASYLIPYVGLTGYVGANPQLTNSTSKRLVAGLLAVESGQDAQIRTLLYQKKDEEIYGMTVANITDKLSELRNTLGHTGIVDEGLVVPECLGAEGRISGNSLSADANSVAYARTPEQIFRIVYGTGDASKPGGFYPNGGRGKYAEEYLK